MKKIKKYALSAMLFFLFYILVGSIKALLSQELTTRYFIDEILPMGLILIPGCLLGVWVASYFTEN